MTPSYLTLKPDDLRIWCVKCRYDLTGAPSSRCPECGEPFNELYLRARQSSSPPITVLSFIRRLVWIPLVVVASGWVHVVLLTLVGVCCSVFMVVNAILLAEELAVRREHLRPERPIGMYRWLVLVCALILLQIGLILGGMWMFEPNYVWS